MRLKKHSLFGNILTAGLASALVLHLRGQTFTTLYSFTALTYGTNSDGVTPNAGLALAGDTLFGTASQGGNLGYGSVFTVKTDGTAFTTLYAFGFPEAEPGAGVLVSGSVVYGTVSSWAATDTPGAVFSINTNGTGFAPIYSFTPLSGGPDGTNSDGAFPGLESAGSGFPAHTVALSSNTLYGAAALGGAFGNGTLFAVGIDGTGFTVLHTFTGLNNAYGNSDGAGPRGLLLSGNTMYGTAPSGGGSASGTVFKINTDGTGFRVLHTFTARPSYGPCTNSDGVYPTPDLAMAGNTLYGTTQCGGGAGFGTVFSVNTDGTGFRVLHAFAAVPPEGGAPRGGLILSGNTLYGTTFGGSSGNGTVFALKTDGTGFTTLYDFTPTSGPNPATNSDGAFPVGLALSGNTLYGTARTGGSSGYGTVFRITLPPGPPQLTIAPDGSGGYFINAQGSPGFTCQLQRAAILTGAWTTSAPQTSDSSGLVVFHDFFPPPERAFYRTVQQ